ncbi:glycosyltransferase family 9 protein [Flavobacterium sp.]|uniref:glycosyltransferase family 9 protein n=1 Tax=Flavobacterium sp. TaxID=239 RepID=UPI0026394778|nr:glycosyltransferase family 9 protein [Flavobacterium sp.]MDD3003874.1 glycosyltransferase family 9 protein [Flavobacterium sp.]
MKILVIQQKMIGDVLASSIICNNLKREYPNSEIDYLIYPFTQPVVENNPNIDQILLFKDEYRKSKKALWNFMLSIRQTKYDVVIDAYGKLESQLIVALSGAKTKIGFHKSYSKIIYTHVVADNPVALTNAGLALESRLNLAKALVKSDHWDIKPHIYLTSAEIENGKKIIEHHQIDTSKKIFMIGVLGSGTTKTYPFEYMAVILDFIVKETDATLIFNYMPSQREEANAIYDLCQPKTQQHIKIDLIPGSIREFLSITHHCDALIGNEGGAVNMAKAINIPTFTIFSTWIKKESWNSFENGKDTVSIHLNDIKPEIYGGESPKKMKDKALELYQKFLPEYIVPLLKKYLQEN